MKKFLFKLVFLSVASISAVAQKSPARVLVLGLDGFSTEGYKVAKHPNIDKLVAEGVLSLSTRPVMPSITLPNWTSHFTSSGPEEHGVTANNWTLEKHPLPAIAVDEQGYYPSIFKVLKDNVRNVKTAYYYNWKELINPINQKYLDEVAFEEKDGYQVNYGKAFDFMLKNRKDPALIFLYSVHTDHAGHEFGWMSEPYIKAIEAADVAIGALLDKLKAEGLYKDTHFLLITDHGGINKGHGGVSMNEMQVPWAITGPKIRKRGLVTDFNSNKNTSLVLARIFNVSKLPEAWTGILPNVIFK
ncbi:Type I phosphodiesterase / nucleotide pyrophosphatase [Pedobacter steynii]|uniref:Type I phosphodiesterase / nucleotide pyrophosphatase n=1 Tax=Pedobacter steynii TaxID=430522 RepID=A0A1G9JCA9_9SPHI|nr:alkaline phosphatase family protein [Pedobacter steynii]NQX38214.1 alkaline phosphatase family protein [Pedobacter steynii]SDL35287.1 Type I phosphodiesterase / nucleotide pyrophosphatase [Pedobacter steynii]